MGEENTIYYMIFQNVMRGITGTSNEIIGTAYMNTGFTNPDKNCYMNAVLQIMMNTGNFVNYYETSAIRNHIDINNNNGSKGGLSGAFSALANCYKSEKYSVLNLQPFIKFMAEHINANLNGHVAIDSCEFQRMFIQFLSEDVNTVSNPIAVNRKYPANDIIVYSNDYFAQMRAYSSSIIKNIFSNCFLSIFLPKTEEHPRFADCLSFIFNQEHERDNCICENCNSKLVVSEKIWNLPEIVIIKLDRPKAENKDIRNVNLVESFNFAEYFHERSEFNRTSYNLYAMVIHIGTLDDAHFVAVLKDKKKFNRWFLYNDEKREK
uniref:ubiquitinyl hydrolase 1 n=1 Tax=Meloidogyne floridensis TaxID=298350 RepID=A0A915NIF5_9BILA